MKSAILGSICVLIGSITLGATTGWFAYNLGSDSLTGVKSPDENPTQKLQKETVNLNKQKPFVIKQEKEIVSQVNDYIKEQRKINKEKEKAEKEKI